MRERWRRRREVVQRPAAPKPIAVRVPEAGLIGWREIRTFLDPGTQVSGKLSFTWPRSMAQVPRSAIGNDAPLFPFGYGLTYAR